MDFSPFPIRKRENNAFTKENSSKILKQQRHFKIL